TEGRARAQRADATPRAAALREGASRRRSQNQARSARGPARAPTKSDGGRREGLASAQLIGDSSVNVLIVDNYDSFTHNLAQALRGLGAHVDVVLNDRVTLEEIERARYGGVLLSPGPCTPDDAGVTLAI